MSKNIHLSHGPKTVKMNLFKPQIFNSDLGFHNI